MCSCSAAMCTIFRSVLILHDITVCSLSESRLLLIKIANPDKMDPQAILHGSMYFVTVLPGSWFDQRGRVQVVDFVELQEGGQVLKLLVSDLKPLAGQRVDDIVRYFGVLRNRQHVVPRTGGRVSDQEHAMSLSL